MAMRSLALFTTALVIGGCGGGDTSADILIVGGTVVDVQDFPEPMRAHAETLAA